MTAKIKDLARCMCLVLAGALMGGMIAFRFISPFNAWTTWMWTGNGMATYAEIQYYKGTGKSAINAQKEYLVYLKAIEKKKPEWNQWKVPWMTDQILNYERVMTYGRLAILETREGTIAEAEKSWSAAEKAAAGLGWRTPGREHIKNVVNGKEAEFRNLEESGGEHR